MNYTYSQLEQIWIQAASGTQYDTQQWAALMAAIALAESSGDPNSTNPTDNNGTQTSWGLWQISNGDHSQPSPNWSDPVTNAKLAIGKLQSQGLGAWGTYNSGAYKKYYNGSTPPAGSFPGNVNASLTGANTTTSNPGLLGLLTSPLSAIPQGLSQGFASAFGAANFKDLAIRAGLLILGGILVVVGIIIMSGREIKAATNIIGVPLGPGAAVGTAVTKSRAAAMAEAKQRANETARQRRLAEAASRPRVSHTTRESHVFHHTVKAESADAS